MKGRWRPPLKSWTWIVSTFTTYGGILLEKYEQCVDTSDDPLVHAIKLRDQDVIRHISFSLYDKPENMIEIIKRGNEVFKSMLCQHNLLGLHQ